jgi:hypothetical protein
MSREKLEIRKGGKLIQTKWVYDRVAKKGEYKEIDRTDTALRHLFDACELAEDVTLEDIFLLLNTELPIFDSIIGNWCKDIVREGLAGPRKPYVHDEEGIEYLELYYTPEITKNYGDERGDVMHGLKRPDFHGIGFVRTKDEVDEWGTVRHKKGERTNWSICMTPTNEMMNIPVKLNNKVEIYEDDYKADVKYPAKKVFEFDNPEYTLLDILHGIIWELSFHGGPQTRDQFSKELRQTVDDIKSGKAETVPASEVFKDLDLDDED